jgi:hypothetical protein
MLHRRSIRAVLLLVLATAWLLVPATTSAHAEVTAGDFHMHVGWGNEPAYAGQPNVVEAFVADHDDKPVTDLAAGDLKVVVSTAGQDSPTLDLSPAFDVEEGFGTPGHYIADLFPTVPGEYTFHFTGKIHDQTVDATVTSGDTTFSPVMSSSDVEFPVKVPTLADVATRLDRIDGRIQEVQGQVPTAQQLADLRTAAADARTAADSASTLATTGLVVGGAGLVIGALGLWLALRARRGTGPG